jgi:hypothetical protein
VKSHTTWYKLLGVANIMNNYTWNVWNVFGCASAAEERGREREREEIKGERRRERHCEENCNSGSVGGFGCSVCGMRLKGLAWRLAAQR